MIHVVKRSGWVRPDQSRTRMPVQAHLVVSLSVPLHALVQASRVLICFTAYISTSTIMWEVFEHSAKV